MLPHLLEECECTLKKKRAEPSRSQWPHRCGVPLRNLPVAGRPCAPARRRRGPNGRRRQLDDNIRDCRLGYV
ncbi:hypothetical protein EVAR_55267_1 [Eumeta japonica]|uniref:Uncharacterized protein n=1 Tax=Eumeta variegata TaxID=151549 RepID=A0A4C1Z5N7_EUMVA|nr:hypothetical protein EVAR_55267_1 [Eumeta japonica]